MAPPPPRLCEIDPCLPARRWLRSEDASMLEISRNRRMLRDGQAVAPVIICQATRARYSDYPNGRRLLGLLAFTVLSTAPVSVGARLTAKGLKVPARRTSRPRVGGTTTGCYCATRELHLGYRCQSLVPPTRDQWGPPSLFDATPRVLGGSARNVVIIAPRDESERSRQPSADLDMRACETSSSWLALDIRDPFDPSIGE